MEQIKTPITLEELDWNAIRSIVQEQCTPLRLGEEVTTDSGGATHLWFMPHIDEEPGYEHDKIHVSFFAVAINKKLCDQTREDFVKLVEQASDSWRDGPNYLQIGAAIGSQEYALSFIALGRYYGLWNILSPQTMGIDDPTLAEKMAGLGMINPQGWSPEGNAKWDSSLLDVPKPTE